MGTMHSGAILSVIWVLAMQPLISLAESAPEKLTLVEVQVLIRDKGPSAITDTSLQNRWDQLLWKVAAGSGAWINVAAELIRYADGEDSESLNAAVGEALAHSPHTVLRKLDGIYLRAENICGNAFGVSGILGASERAAMTSLAAQERAVAAVRHTNLAFRRNRCLELIKREIEELKG